LVIDAKKQTHVFSGKDKIGTYTADIFFINAMQNIILLQGRSASNCPLISHPRSLAKETHNSQHIAEAHTL
jgi:hypothetical protein